MNSTKYKITIGAAALCLIMAFVVFGQAQTQIQKLSVHQPIDCQIKGGAGAVEIKAYETVFNY